MPNLSIWNTEKVTNIEQISKDFSPLLFKPDKSLWDKKEEKF